MDLDLISSHSKSNPLIPGFHKNFVKISSFVCNAVNRQTEPDKWRDTYENITSLADIITIIIITGTGDWKTDGQHYRRCRGVQLPVPAAVHGTAEGECGLISKHVHHQLARCNPLFYMLNVLVPTGFVLVGPKKNKKIIIVKFIQCHTVVTSMLLNDIRRRMNGYLNRE